MNHAERQSATWSEKNKDCIDWKAEELAKEWVIIFQFKFSLLSLLSKKNTAI